MKIKQLLCRHRIVENIDKLILHNKYYEPTYIVTKKKCKKCGKMIYEYKNIFKSDWSEL